MAFALLAFCATAKLEVSHSDAEVETIGRISRCGFPVPWIEYADGMSIASSLGGAKYCLLPVDLLFWSTVGGLLFRVHGKRGFPACPALPRLLLLAPVLSVCADIILPSFGLR
ncbi:MAG: hypothetical protein IJS32_10450 [Kiritimatiellae bacterium]|nr:hypothetical protein [Kiritimatiellia bacterium]